MRAWSPAAFACVGLVASLLAVPAAVADVVVVRSSDLPALRAVEDVFAKGMGKVRSLSLSEAGEEGLGPLLHGASLVLVLGPEAARAVAAQHPTVPVLMALVPNPEKTGLAAPWVPVRVSLADQLVAVQRALPGRTRLGVLYDPALSAGLVAECEAAAAKAGMTLVKQEVPSRPAIANAARALLPQIDALWLLPDSTVITADAFKFLVQTAFGAKVPLIGFSEGMARAGALVAVEPSPADTGRAAIAAAARLLAGQPAAADRLPGAVFLNAKSADLLGLALSDEARAGAARVYE